MDHSSRALARVRVLSALLLVAACTAAFSFSAVAAALPEKILVDEAGRDLAPTTLILGQVKADGWSPAQARIEQTTTVVSVPRAKDESGRYVVPDRFLVAQSEKGSAKSTAWSGEMARRKSDKGMQPVASCSTQVLALRHPTPVDAEQTLRDFALFFHVDPTTGKTTTIAFWQGRLARLPEGSTIMNEMVVDESSYFVPTKTHTNGMRFPAGELPAPSDGEKRILTRPEADTAGCAALIEKLVMRAPR
jgi:hypothetical protein